MPMIGMAFEDAATAAALPASPHHLKQQLPEWLRPARESAPVRAQVRAPQVLSVPAEPRQIPGRGLARELRASMLHAQYEAWGPARHSIAAQRRPNLVVAGASPATAVGFVALRKRVAAQR
jgi:hypothetical protein